MLKYRLLSNDELEGLKDEFVKFLIVHGVDAPEWQRIKETSPEKALYWIEVFSDFIFENIVNKVRYLEFADQRSVRLFYCDEHTIYLISMESVAGADTYDDIFAEMAAHPEKFLIQKANKPYNPDRQTEIFRMIKAGAKVTDSKWYDLLSSISTP